MSAVTTIVNTGDQKLCFNSYDASGKSLTSGCLDSQLSQYQGIAYDSSESAFMALSGPRADNHITLPVNTDVVLVDCNSIVTFDKNQNILSYSSIYFTMNGMC